ncbi:MAG: CsbD family protein [Terracidiphilus sp.]|jgi:uncharacterized protein YjbJ (UPF0337 family)
MNKDQVNGKVDELVGAAKRKAGELTNDVPLQVKGAAQQVKGKFETAWGKAKNAVEDANAKDAARHADEKNTARPGPDV